ncbi:MAG: Ku protein [Patescibacteria group bacterium]
MSDPKHEWRGTITIGSFELAVRAYPAFGQATAPTLYQVHRDPCTPHKAKAAGKKDRTKRSKASADAGAPRGRVLSQPVCMRCGSALKPDEIALQITMPKGAAVCLETNDLDAMSFEKSERVIARLASANDRTVNALGFDRRLYLLPEPVSVEDYWIIFTALQETNRIGFIPFIALKSDRAYVATVRPIVIPVDLFGDSSVTMPREILVLDCLGDTDKLKDPMELSSYPGKSKIERIKLDHVKSTFTGRLIDPIDPDECVNPRTAYILRAVRRARRRALAKS